MRRPGGSEVDGENLSRQRVTHRSLHRGGRSTGAVDGAPELGRGAQPGAGEHTEQLPERGGPVIQQAGDRGSRRMVMVVAQPAGPGPVAMPLPRRPPCRRAPSRRVPA